MRAFYQIRRNPNRSTVASAGGGHNGLLVLSPVSKQRCGRERIELSS